MKINPIKIGVWAFGALVALGFVTSSFFTTDETQLYYVQDRMFSSTSAYMEAGIHFKTPMFTRIEPWKRAASIDFDSTPDGEFTRNFPSIGVTFADSYTADVPINFRFRTPTDPEKFIALNLESRTFDNYVDTMLTKIAKNTVVVTATAFTGEEFVQGGINQFKLMVMDQLENGLYITEKKRVRVVEDTTESLSSDQDVVDKEKTKSRWVTKNVIKRDANGNPIRQRNQLLDFGVTVVSVDIGELDLKNTQLFTLLNKKRELVARRIESIQNQDTLKEEAKTAVLQAEVTKQREINEAKKRKELAVIERQRETEMEREQAAREKVQAEKEKELASIRKQKELAIATANRDIQKAAAEAARFEAQAIREKGLAEAEVEQAKLNAKQSAADIYMAEMQVELARATYPYLKDFSVTMPEFVMNGGSSNESSIPNSLDVFTALSNRELVKSIQAE